jgi:8-oxo-dGTP pyrophosphatase MutT (NUDIX family)
VIGSKGVCVGAIIRDEQGRVFVQRRSATRRVFPGVWDIVGGHVEPNESIEAALEREIHEETGWQLRHIVALVAEWEWEHNGVARRELDYLVEVKGDLASPRLEPLEHDAYAWIGVDNLERLAGWGSEMNARLRAVVIRSISAPAGQDR